MKKLTRKQLRQIVEGTLKENAHVRSGWTENGYEWEAGPASSGVLLEIDGKIVELSRNDIEALAWAVGLVE